MLFLPARLLIQVKTPTSQWKLVYNTLVKIGILGGSFDPPHLGHYLIARQVLELTEVEEIWLLPYCTTASFDKVFQKKLSLSSNRLEMTKLLEEKTIKASDFEIRYNKS